MPQAPVTDRGCKEGAGLPGPVGPAVGWGNQTPRGPAAGGGACGHPGPAGCAGGERERELSGAVRRHVVAREMASPPARCPGLTSGSPAASLTALGKVCLLEHLC